MIRLILVSTLFLNLNILAKNEYQAEAINIETGEVFLGKKVKWQFSDSKADMPRFESKAVKNSYAEEKAKVYALAECSGINPEDFWRTNKYTIDRYSRGNRIKKIRLMSPLCKVSKLNEKVFIKSLEEYEIKKENLLNKLDKNWDDLTHLSSKCVEERFTYSIYSNKNSLEGYIEGPTPYELPNIVDHFINHARLSNQCIRAEYESYPNDFVDFVEKEFLAEYQNQLLHLNDANVVTIDDFVASPYFEPDLFVNLIYESLVLKEKILEEERTNQEKIILAALVDRCIGFGWDSDKDIHACVNQEAYRDLLIQEQKIEIQKLEEKLANSYSQAQLDDRPIFLDILNFYSQQTYSKNNVSLQNEIARLNSQNSSLRSIQNTQRALESLYNN